MVTWIVRALLLVAGVIASWWVAKDALIFPVVEMVVAIALVMLVLGAAVFWRPRWLANFSKRKTP